MKASAWATERLQDPGVRRAALAGAGVAVLHVLVLGLIMSQRPELMALPEPDRPVEPIYLTITPRARPARIPPTDVSSAERALDLPPIAVRSAAAGAVPADVAPLVVDTPPPGVRPTAPGRVIPQSWRERCDLGEGDVSDAAYRACRESFLQAATPREAPSPRSDPRDGWAAIAARNQARYDYFRSEAPTGSGNARPSSTPGSNFGWGDMDRGVIYTEGSRPEVNGGID